jgi:hypothetical protein
MNNIKSFFVSWYKRSPITCLIISISGLVLVVLALFALLLGIFGKLDDFFVGLGSFVVGMGSLSVLALMIILPIGFCCLPIIIAIFRKHSNIAPIILVSIFFSWTIIGWFIALIWAFTDNTRNRNDFDYM